MQKPFLSEYVEPPEGLHKLLETDRVTVKQIKLAQDAKRYDAVVYEAVLDTAELLLRFVEKSSFVQRFWCGSHRAFDMEVRNVNGKLVMHLQRPMKCPSVICFCCPYEMKVEAPVGESLGSIVQNYGRLGHTFSLKDWNGNVQLDLKGPWFSYTCCLDLIFKIYAHGYHKSIGRIIHRWNQEFDSFRIDFPLDLDYRMKLLLICAAIFLRVTPDEFDLSNEMLEVSFVSEFQLLGEHSYIFDLVKKYHSLGNGKLVEYLKPKGY